MPQSYDRKMLTTISKLLGKPTISTVVLSSIWIHLVGMSAFSIIDTPYPNVGIDEHAVDQIQVQFAGAKQVEAFSAAPIEVPQVEFERQHEEIDHELMSRLEVTKQLTKAKISQPVAKVQGKPPTEIDPIQDMDRALATDVEFEQKRESQTTSIPRKKSDVAITLKSPTAPPSINVANVKTSMALAQLDVTKTSTANEARQVDRTVEPKISDSPPSRELDRAATAHIDFHRQLKDPKDRVPRQRPKSVVQFRPSVASVAVPQLAGTNELEPPTFANNRPPPYPVEAYRAGIEGEVLLRVHVSSTGQVESVSISRSSGHSILDVAARDAVKTWQGTPAQKNEQAVATVEYLPVRFQLRRN
jgi:TonB family protein